MQFKGAGKDGTCLAEEAGECSGSSCGSAGQQIVNEDSTCCDRAFCERYGGLKPGEGKNGAVKCGDCGYCWYQQNQGGDKFCAVSGVTNYDNEPDQGTGGNGDPEKR